jgi:hypothetical protein
MPEDKLNNKDPLDFQFGQSQEQIEELRSEFMSIGGLVSALPEVGSVRDFTIIGIPSNDASGDRQVNLYMMMEGKWFNLNSYGLEPTGNSGSIQQYNTNAIYTPVDGAGTETELVIANEAGTTDQWDLIHSTRMGYNKDGGLIIEKAGRYSGLWSISFSAGSANQDFEAGFWLNGVNQKVGGWAQRKIGTASDIGSFSAGGIADLVKGDRVSLAFANITPSASTIIINHASFTLNRIR